MEGDGRRWRSGRSTPPYPSLTSALAPAAKPEPEIVASLAQTAEAALRLEGDVANWLRFELDVARAYDDPDAEAWTSALTIVLTAALKEWAYARGWHSWRELQVPVGRGNSDFGAESGFSTPTDSPFPSATGSRTPLRPCRDGGPPT